MHIFTSAETHTDNITLKNIEIQTDRQIGNGIN